MSKEESEEVVNNLMFAVFRNRENRKEYRSEPLSKTDFVATITGTMNRFGHDTKVPKNLSGQADKLYNVYKKSFDKAKELSELKGTKADLLEQKGLAAAFKGFITEVKIFFVEWAMNASEKKLQNKLQSIADSINPETMAEKFAKTYASASRGVAAFGRQAKAAAAGFAKGVKSVAGQRSAKVNPEGKASKGLSRA